MLNFSEFLMSFLKQKVNFFSKFGSFFRVMREFFCTFLTETLYDIDKSSRSKCKFSDLPLLALQITKFLMSFLEPKVIFSTKLLKIAHQIDFFLLLSGWIKIHQILRVIFETTCPFCNFCITL